MRDFRGNGYALINDKWMIQNLEFIAVNILWERKWKWKLHQKETESLALWSFIVHK